MIVTLNIKNKNDIKKLSDINSIEILDIFDIENIDKNDEDYQLYLEYKNKKFISLEKVLKEFQ